MDLFSWERDITVGNFAFQKWLGLEIKKILETLAYELTAKNTRATRRVYRASVWRRRRTYLWNIHIKAGILLWCLNK